jgi:charged multivesicular body protein 2A
MLRENKRMLDKAIRDLDRERMGLQNQEKKLVVEIKKAAKQGQMVRGLPLFYLPRETVWVL